MVFFFTRHGGGVFLIFTWHGEGWQVANKTAALWEASWDPEKGEFEEAVKLLWRGAQCLERWQ